MWVLFSTHKGRTGLGRLYTLFTELLVQSDALTLHCPLNASTRHMIGASEFSHMRCKPLPGAEAVQALADQLIDNIEAFVSGQPVHQVIGGFKI